MAEIANPNLPTFFQDTPRSGEVPGADWDDGLNKGGSCSPGIGINTGDYSPKATDWPEVEIDPANGQSIGGVAAPITVDQDPDFNDQASFVQADGDIAPDGELKALSGVFNKTGKTVPNGSWCWGVKAVA